MTSPAREMAPEPGNGNRWPRSLAIAAAMLASTLLGGVVVWWAMTAYPGLRPKVFLRHETLVILSYIDAFGPLISVLNTFMLAANLVILARLRQGRIPKTRQKDASVDPPGGDAGKAEEVSPKPDKRTRFGRDQGLKAAADPPAEGREKGAAPPRKKRFGLFPVRAEAPAAASPAEAKREDGPAPGQEVLALVDEVRQGGEAAARPMEEPKPPPESPPEEPDRRATEAQGAPLAEPHADEPPEAADAPRIGLAGEGGARQGDGFTPGDEAAEAQAEQRHGQGPDSDGEGLALATRHETEAPYEASPRELAQRPFRWDDDLPAWQRRGVDSREKPDETTGAVLQYRIDPRRYLGKPPFPMIGDDPGGPVSRPEGPGGWTAGQLRWHYPRTPRSRVVALWNDMVNRQLDEEVFYQRLDEYADYVPMAVQGDEAYPRSQNRVGWIKAVRSKRNSHFLAFPDHDRNFWYLLFSLEASVQLKFQAHGGRVQRILLRHIFSVRRSGDRLLIDRPALARGQDAHNLELVSEGVVLISVK